MNYNGKICFLYPGQGAQYPGMGRDLHDSSAVVRDLFDLASDTAGIDMRKLLFEADEQELRKTENTQAAVTLMNLAVREYLSGRGILSDMAAGFSLGEYSALVDGRIIGLEAVFPLVISRGKVMAAAAEGLNGAMAAVIGLDAAAVDTIVGPMEGVYAANYNAPSQTVISGTAGAVEEASVKLKEAGAKRVVPLKVSGPFHTPLLEEAKAAFEELLSAVQFFDPVKPVFSNVTGERIVSGEEARLLCARQITAPVRWTEVEGSLCAAGAAVCVESGPGKVLTGLWKSGPACADCMPADPMDSAERAVETISGDKEQHA